MLAWIRGGEGEITAERRATNTHAEQWARSLSIVYGHARSLSFLKPKKMIQNTVIRMYKTNN